MQDNWRDTKYSITINSRGQRFLGGDITANTSSAIIFIDGSLSVSAYEIQYPSVSINATSAASASGTRIKFVSSSINIDGAVITVGTNIPIPRSSINIETSVSIDATKVMYASASLSGEVTSDFPFIRKVWYASASVTSDSYCHAFVGEKAVVDLTINGYVLTLAQEILFPLVQISASASVNVSALEILYTSSSTSSESSVNVSAIEILHAVVTTSSESQVDTSSYKIAYASTSITGMSVTLTMGTEIQIARISILAVATSLVAQTIKFSAIGGEDTQSIRTLMYIDNKPITEHNRSLDAAINQPMYENNNWAGARRRYYKSSSGRKTFSISWSMLPNSRQKAVDLKFARDFISEVGSDPDVHTFKIINLDSSNTTPYTKNEYNVIVKDYSESLIRRDLGDESYWWNCNLTLEEV